MEVGQISPQSDGRAAETLAGFGPGKLGFGRKAGPNRPLRTKDGSVARIKTGETAILV